MCKREREKERVWERKGGRERKCVREKGERYRKKSDKRVTRERNGEREREVGSV